MSNWRHLDRQLKSVADAATGTMVDVPVFRSPQLNQSALASGLDSDLHRTLRVARLEWPTVVEELNSPVTLRERHDALIAYHHLMERGDFADPVLQRARIITQLYFDLVYFRDRVMVLLREKVGKRPPKFAGIPYLSEWLELVGGGDFAGRIKSLRNGFAHGKWSFLPDFSGIACYPGQQAPYTRCELTQLDLGVAHALLYAFQLVLLQTASEEL